MSAFHVSSVMISMLSYRWAWREKEGDYRAREEGVRVGTKCREPSQSSGPARRSHDCQAGDRVKGPDHGGTVYDQGQRSRRKERAAGEQAQGTGCWDELQANGSQGAEGKDWGRLPQYEGEQR